LRLHAQLDREQTGFAQRHSRITRVLRSSAPLRRRPMPVLFGASIPRVVISSRTRFTEHDRPRMQWTRAGIDGVSRWMQS
jgi:hypothetical protein